jgi:hypothetical protein
MKKIILKGEHWQFFIIIILGFILQNFTIEGKPILNLTFVLIGASLYFAWVIMAGNTLFQILPKKIELNYNLWVVNSFIWLITYFAVIVLSDGQGMKFNGVEVIPMLYVFYAIINSMAFPAKALKSLEKGKEAELKEYIGDFFLIIFLPIGIWFLQPRINKIANNLELNLSEQ